MISPTTCWKARHALWIDTQSLEPVPGEFFAHLIVVSAAQRPRCVTPSPRFPRYRHEREIISIGIIAFGDIEERKTWRFARVANF
jgi:hypothetical protein